MERTFRETLFNRDDGNFSLVLNHRFINVRPSPLFQRSKSAHDQELLFCRGISMRGLKNAFVRKEKGQCLISSQLKVIRSEGNLNEKACNGRPSQESKF